MKQKAAIAVSLVHDPDIIIFDEPTKGIDVGAKAEIYRLMEDLVAGGKAIIMVSSELPEILGICEPDHHCGRGKITAEFSGKTATDKEILAAALGGVPV